MFSDAGAGLDRLPSRARGLTNKEIGALVDLSANTIKDLLEKIAAAFDVRSRGGRRRSVPRGPHLAQLPQLSRRTARPAPPRRSYLSPPSAPQSRKRRGVATKVVDFVARYAR